MPSSSKVRGSDSQVEGSAELSEHPLELTALVQAAGAAVASEHKQYA